MPHVRNKKVLEVGPAELVGTTNAHKFERWIHGRISKVASKLVGVELSPLQVASLASKGYDIRQGNAESFQLGEVFDVVVAGEVIEHLSNPGLFLGAAWAHLREGGSLVITTPNRYSILSIGSVIKKGKVPRYEKDIAKHVTYFDSDALQSLLERSGYRDIEIGYCSWVGEPSKNAKARIGIAIARRLRPVMLPVLVAVARK